MPRGGFIRPEAPSPPAQGPRAAYPCDLLAEDWAVGSPELSAVDEGGAGVSSGPAEGAAATMGSVKFDFGAIPDLDMDTLLPELPELRSLPGASPGLGAPPAAHPMSAAAPMHEVDGSSEAGLDFLTEASHTPRQSSGSNGSKAAGGSSLDSGSQWQGPYPLASNFAANTILQSLSSLLPGAGSAAPNQQQGMSVEHALLLNMSRTEAEMRKIALERDVVREELTRCQAACRQGVQEKASLEDKVRSLEQLVKSMGQEAFSQALSYLRQAFDKAPIPRGIRFAPIDAELFEYLEQKLSGVVEDVGLDRFLVQRLRGVAHADGLIPEVELLKFPRPWHLPGLDVSSDGKGLTGFYFVRPEWRPNERRRRREADMAPSDPKPPCWKESCQPTHFDELGRRCRGRPERRMFRFKLPGAREGPAGEKEKWKMYEYTLKSDMEMFEDRRLGLPVWVVCKVVREGPMTREEEDEKMGRSGHPPGGRDTSSNGGADMGSGSKEGGGDAGSWNGFGRGGGGDGMGPSNGAGGAGGSEPSYGYSTGGMRLALGSHAAPSTSDATPSTSTRAPGPQESGLGQSKGRTAPTDSSVQEGSTSSEQGGSGTTLRGSKTGTRAKPNPSSLSAIRLTCSASNDPLPSRGPSSISRMPLAGASRIDDWLHSTPSLPASPLPMPREPVVPALSALPLESAAGAGGRAGFPLAAAELPCPTPCWLEGQPDAQLAVGSLLEDWVVGKLTAQLAERDSKGARAGGAGGEGGGSLAAVGLRLSPPAWAVAPPASFWEDLSRLEAEQGEEEMPLEESVEASEEAEEEWGSAEEEVGLRPPPESEVAQLGAEVVGLLEAVAQVSAGLGPQLPAFGEVAGMLRRLQGAVHTLLACAALDEAAAQLWLLALRASLQGVRQLATAVDQIGASRILLVLQSPEILAALQVRVKALGRSLALVPKVFADSVSDRRSDDLYTLRSDMQRCSFAPSETTRAVQQRLTQLLAAVASRKATQGGGMHSEGETGGVLKGEKGAPPKQGEEWGSKDKLKAAPLKARIMGLGLETSHAVYQRIYGTQHQQTVVEVFRMLGADGNLGEGGALGARQERLHQELQQLKAMRKGKFQGLRALEAEEEESTFSLEAGSEMASGVLVLLEACQLAAQAEAAGAAGSSCEKGPSDPVAPALPRAREAEAVPGHAAGGAGGPSLGTASSLDGRSGPLPGSLAVASSRQDLAHYRCRVFSTADLQAALGADLAKMPRWGEVQAVVGGAPVSVEVLDPRVASKTTLLRHTEALAPLRHPHIHSLLGCCPEAACLVYDQMPPLSLEDFLGAKAAPDTRVRPALMWFVRMRIMWEVASALLFLHSQEPGPVLHRDIRPANIVLISQEVPGPGLSASRPAAPASSPGSAPSSDARTARSASLPTGRPCASPRRIPFFREMAWLPFFKDGREKRGSPASGGSMVQPPSGVQRSERSSPVPLHEGSGPEGAPDAPPVRVSSRLARVGLAALMPARKLGKTPVQDVVYLDPEFPRTDELVPASDVYALGVVLVQLLTGQSATAALGAVTAFSEGHKCLQEVLDPAAGPWPLGPMQEVAELAAACTDMRRSLRPSLADKIMPTLERVRMVAAEAEGL